MFEVNNKFNWFLSSFRLTLYLFLEKLLTNQSIISPTDLFDSVKLSCCGVGRDWSSLVWDIFIMLLLASVWSSSGISLAIWASIQHSRLLLTARAGSCLIDDKWLAAVVEWCRVVCVYHSGGWINDVSSDTRRVRCPTAGKTQSRWAQGGGGSDGRRGRIQCLPGNITVILQ